jgi:hypothetical protein
MFCERYWYVPSGRLSSSMNICMVLAKANIVFKDNAHIGGFSAVRTQYPSDLYVLVQYRVEGTVSNGHRSTHTTHKHRIANIRQSKMQFFIIICNTCLSHPIYICCGLYILYSISLIIISF